MRTTKSPSKPRSPWMASDWKTTRCLDTGAHLRFRRLAASLQVVILHHHAGRVPQVVVQRRKDFQRGCRVGPLQGCGEVGVRLQPISDQRWNGGLVVVAAASGRRGWPQGSVPLHPTTLAPVQVTCKGFLVQQVLQHGPLKRLEPLCRVELAKGQNYILLQKPE